MKLMIIVMENVIEAECDIKLQDGYLLGLLHSHDPIMNIETKMRLAKISTDT